MSDRIDPEVIETAARAIKGCKVRDVEYSLAHYLPEAKAAIRAADEARGLKVELGGPIFDDPGDPSPPTHWRLVSDWRSVERSSKD